MTSSGELKALREVHIKNEKWRGRVETTELRRKG